MRFIIDAQLPPALVVWLLRQGHDAEHVFALGIRAEPDTVIANHAEASGAMVISKDADFLALRLPDRFPVVWLRCGNATTRRLIAWLDPRWPKVVALLAQGERVVEVH